MGRTLAGNSPSWNPDTYPTGRKSRMQIVKEAASKLVAILDPKADNRVAVGVVPWHINVRLSETARQRLGYRRLGGISGEPPLRRQL